MSDPAAPQNEQEPPASPYFDRLARWKAVPGKAAELERLLGHPILREALGVLDEMGQAAVLEPVAMPDGVTTSLTDRLALKYMQDSGYRKCFANLRSLSLQEVEPLKEIHEPYRYADAVPKS